VRAFLSGSVFRACIPWVEGYNRIVWICEQPFHRFHTSPSFSLDNEVSFSKPVKGALKVFHKGTGDSFLASAFLNDVWKIASDSVPSSSPFQSIQNERRSTRIGFSLLCITCHDISLIVRGKNCSLHCIKLSMFRHTRTFLRRLCSSFCTVKAAVIQRMMAALSLYRPTASVCVAGTTISVSQ